MTLPSVHDIVRVGVDDFVLGLDDPCRALLVTRLLGFIIVISDSFSSRSILLGLFLGSKLVLMLLLLLVDVFLELGFALIHVHIVDQLVTGLHAHSHQLRLASVTLALNVLEDLVVGGDLLLVLSQDSVAAIDGRVCDELLELGHVDKVRHVAMEHHIVSHAYIVLLVSVVLAFTDAVGQAPRGSFLAVGLGDFLALRLLDQLVPAHVHKRLLVEERFLVIADHLLGEGLDAEA